MNNAKSDNNEVKESNNQSFISLQKLGGALSENISLTLVNLFDEENAPEVCNVGVAHEKGLQIALSAVKNKRDLIIRIDADVTLPVTYIQSALDLFKGTNIDGATGPKTFVPDESIGSLEDYKELKVIQRYDADFDLIIELLQKRYGPHSLSLIQRGLHESMTPRMLILPSGNNMVFMKERCEEVGHLQEIPGAEDMVFALELIRNGRNMVLDESLRITIKERASLRTEVAQGHGFRIFEQMQRGTQGHLTFSFQGRLIEKAIFQTINTLNQHRILIGNELSDLLMDFPQVLSEEDKRVIKERNDRFPFIEDVLHSPFVEELSMGIFFIKSNQKNPCQGKGLLVLREVDFSSGTPARNRT